MIETSRLEFKRTCSDEIKKEIVAFANSDGGDLIIDVGKPDGVSGRVMNVIRDAISPDITLLTYVKITNQLNKSLVHVNVSKGGK